MEQQLQSIQHQLETQRTIDHLTFQSICTQLHPLASQYPTKCNDLLEKSKQKLFDHLIIALQNNSLVIDDTYYFRKVLLDAPSLRAKQLLERLDQYTIRYWKNYLPDPPKTKIATKYAYYDV